MIVLSLLTSVPAFKTMDKVTIDESKTRYYLNFDFYGKLPDSNTIKEIESKIHSGDELAIRFFPNYIFEKNIEIGDRINKNDTMRILFPPQMSDTFSVPTGSGSVVFFTNQAGKYRLLIQDASAPIQASAIAYSTISKKLISENSNKLDRISTELHKKKYDNETNVFVFENIPFTPGLKRIVIYQIAGDSAYFLINSEPIAIGDNFVGVNLIQNRDYGQQAKFVMKNNPGSAYYEAIIPGTEIVPGVQNLNIKLDYTDTSWNKRTKHVDDKFLRDGITLTIRQERELPSSIRARAGFAIFNKGTEPRLITNFVMILFPEEYFSNTLKWYKRINPTIGLQVGGTGTKELIPIGGISIKLIAQGDIIFGTRFGANDTPLTEPINFLKQNAYFGATLDPWLFVELKNRLAK